MASSSTQKLHIFFFPLMASGHMIPMVDAARLFVGTGLIKATLLTTSANAPLLENSIKLARESGQQLELIVLSFPSAAKDLLPEGKEFLTSPTVSLKFFRALELLREPLEQVIREQKPNCIISDMYLPWTSRVASEYGIARLVFHTMGFFSLCVIDSIGRYGDELKQKADDTNCSVLLSGLPHCVKMKCSQLGNIVGSRNDFTVFLEEVKESERNSFGAVVNSFYDIEPEYVEHYKRVIGSNTWHIGPVCQCNSNLVEMAARGAPTTSSSDVDDRILSWLDSKPANSVVYVCFGTLSRLTNGQMHEISLGLHDSKHHFIWVTNNHSLGIVEQENGLFISGWAPQLRILNHRSVGGFMTHCGWNSVMESVGAGVPMITWPMFADQFYNEKLIVDILKIGVRIGAQVWGLDEENKPLVRRQTIKNVVTEFMQQGGQLPEGLRMRACELKEKARKAFEAGGSSSAQIRLLIHELLAT